MLKFWQWAGIMLFNKDGVKDSRAEKMAIIEARHREMCEEAVEKLKPAGDLREPVLSFVRCVSLKPSRFKLRLLTSTYTTNEATRRKTHTEVYVLQDMKLKEEYTFEIKIKLHAMYYNTNEEFTVGNLPFTLTQVEKIYIRDTLKPIFGQRVKRYFNILALPEIRVKDAAKALEEIKRQEYLQKYI